MAPLVRHFRAILPVAFAVTLVAVGQLCMRRGMVELNPVGDAADIVESVKMALRQPEIITWAITGAIAYVLATVVWLRVLARHELSFVFPFTSISYVLVYLGAVLWPALGEQSTPIRTLGIVIIMLGVVMVARSRRSS